MRVWSGLVSPCLLNASYCMKMYVSQSIKYMILMLLLVIFILRISWEDISWEDISVGSVGTGSADNKPSKMSRSKNLAIFEDVQQRKRIPIY